MVAKNAKRLKIISFRASDSEYERLLALCDTMRARSLSSLARSVVCELIEQSTDPEDGTVIASLKQLSSRVQTLDIEIRRLRSMIEQRSETRYSAVTAAGDVKEELPAAG